MMLPAAMAAVTIVLGALVAADMALPLAVVVGLAILLGLLNGSVSGLDVERAHASGLGLVGVAVALFVVSLLTGQVASVRAAWVRVVVRVVGSWVASRAVSRCWAGPYGGPERGKPPPGSLPEVGEGRIA